MKDQLDTEGSAVHLISDEDAGNSGTGIMAVTVDRVPASKAAYMELSGTPDIEKGHASSKKKRGGMKVTFRVSPCLDVVWTGIWLQTLAHPPYATCNSCIQS
jgi:hypothetical protein